MLRKCIHVLTTNKNKKPPEAKHHGVCLEFQHSGSGAEGAHEFEASL